MWWPLPPLPGTPTSLESLVAGEEIETARGPFFRRRIVLDLNEAYGDTRLGDFLRVTPHAAAALARVPDLADVPLESVLFLDTETTGLAGGTGTYAFLVGIGYFRNTGGDVQFVLDQCFMRSYAEERAMLTWLGEHLQGYAALLTFNGKSFDVPLLQTRFLMSRLRLNWDEWLHFDLLHASRRVWRHALPTCALQHLERNVLNVGRENDIESFLIPAIYHQYLRDGDGRYLARVFNHNRADVLAMVALATRACAMLEDALEPDAQPRSRYAGQTPKLSAHEQLGLARIFEQMSSAEAAERAYRAALAGSLPSELRARASLGLAALLKRHRRHHDAAEIWQGVVDQFPAHSVAALIELSKYWEHKRDDAARAFELARRARDRWLAGLPAAERRLPGLSGAAPASGGWSTAPPPAPDDFSHRLERLDRKRRGMIPADTSIGPIV
jgi:uncharacterized protein